MKHRDSLNLGPDGRKRCFPDLLILVLANQGCPCGHYGDATRACTCPEGAVSRYRKRLSGPLLDRIDLHVEVPRVEYEKLAGDGLAEPSAVVRARVEAARGRQWARFEGTRLDEQRRDGGQGSPPVVRARRVR